MINLLMEDIIEVANLSLEGRVLHKNEKVRPKEIKIFLIEGEELVKYGIGYSHQSLLEPWDRMTT